MATFYGGEQLVGIITQNKIGTGAPINVTDQVQYTVPAGHVAYFSFLGSNFPGGLSGDIFSPNFGAFNIPEIVAISGPYNAPHPYSGNDDVYFMDEGMQYRLTIINTGSHAPSVISALIYLYKKP